MSVIAFEVRRGAYADSIVLMQLQSALAALDGVEDAGAVMATAANRELLAANGLLPDEEITAGDADLLVVVRAVSRAKAGDALEAIDRLRVRKSGDEGHSYRHKSLKSALAARPQAHWVSISVPGQYAAAVAREVLNAGRNVFLYSDNVSLADEVSLKRDAQKSGLLVMGPDCGSAILAGVGFGFANRVRRGSIGIVAASGTGLQVVASRIDELGRGVSHAIGTGGRDLSSEVGGATARQALELLARDPSTRVIVLISKPPAVDVAARVLAAARASAKPVVIALAGAVPPVRQLGNLSVARSLRDAADRAVSLLETSDVGIARPASVRRRTSFVRGLFSGGTIAAEVYEALKYFVAPLATNLKGKLGEPSAEEHVILDLGADELTVGRPHPMIDQTLLLERLEEESSRPGTGLILLDLVLGDGAHSDPAGSLAPTVRAVVAKGEVEVAVVVVGTENDLQNLPAQIELLKEAGARVFRSIEELARFTVERYGSAEPDVESAVDISFLDQPGAINVGLEHFYDSMVAQGADVVHVDWRPPAGGDAKLQALLAKMG